MRARHLLFYVSTGILALIALYLCASVYACSGAANGRVGSCIAMTGGDFVRSLTAQISVVAALAGLYQARRMRRLR